MSSKKKSKKKNKDIWFKPVRGSYIPANSKGWLTYIPFIAYLLSTFFITRDYEVSRLSKIYLIIVQWAFAAILMTMIAREKS